MLTLDLSKGRVSLWRYRDGYRNFPGFHVTADGAGCGALVRGLAQLRTAQPLSSSIAVELEPVTPQILAVPNNRAGNATVYSFRTWEIQINQEQAGPHFEFEETEKTCRLNVSLDNLAVLDVGIRDIAQGKGDYSAGGTGSNALWFWWFPKLTPPGRK